MRPSPAGRRVLRVAPLPGRILRNPYADLLYRHLEPWGVERVDGAELTFRWLLAARRRIDCLHFHWDQMFYEVGTGPRALRGPRSWARLLAFTARLITARAIGYRLCWTIHEVRPHESRSRMLDRLAARALARACQALTAHDRATVQRARQELGGAAREVAIVPHGSYTEAYPPGRSRATVRREIEVPDDAFTILCFGHLRRYKRIEALLQAFARVSSPRVALVVAGAPLWRTRLAGDDWDRHIVERLERAAANDPRIKYLPGFVPPERVGELYRAVDAAVLPRDDGWTSGSLVLALSLGAPAIVARCPAYVELTGGEEAGWLFEPGDVASLAATMARAATDSEEARRRGVHARRRAASLGWERSAALLAPILRGGDVCAHAAPILARDRQAPELELASD